jgi:hypothetical protein
MKTIEISEEPLVSVADIVEYAQTKFKGHHFCSLRIMLLPNKRIRITRCKYQPIKESEIPNYVKIIGFKGETACVLEHFLQSVRKKFPGVSFYEIYVRAHHNWQNVSPKPPY